MLYHPLLSTCVFCVRSAQGKVSSPRHYIGTYLELDGGRFEVFRHVEVSGPGKGESPVVLVLQFEFPGSTLKKDKRQSFFQIPLFAGLPGFRGKLWTFDHKGHVFQGVYEWESNAHAEGYLRSFAVAYVKKKASPGSVVSRILQNTTLEELMTVTRNPRP